MEDKKVVWKSFHGLRTLKVSFSPPEESLQDEYLKWLPGTED